MSIQTDAKAFTAANLDSGIVTRANGSNFDDEYYRGSHEKAGVAVIFTQKVFANNKLQARLGADIDERKLQSTLSRYGYEVRNYVDLTTNEIEEELKDVAREDQSKNNSLIVIMMSHGGKDEYTNEGVIYTKDGNIKVDSLWRYFAGDRCPSLVGKPKLFFIQACRGSLTDFGTILEEDDENVRRNAIAPDIPQRIPIMADILVMFSSADDHVAYRNPTEGSWFIQALCMQLELYINCEQDKDLMAILTSVNRYVAFFNECVHNNIRFKQMPVIMSMLTKTFVFDRKFFK